MDWLTEIKSLAVGKVLTNVSLKKYTTFKVGGVARAMVFPENEDQLIKLLSFLKEKRIKFMVLGCGSNVLFSDLEYDGVIVKLDFFNQIWIEDTKVVVGAGVSLPSLALRCIKNHLSGLEFAAGIPGSVGGSVAMNAGAYGSEMAAIVTAIKVLTPELQIVNMNAKDLQFGYRTSFLKENEGFICLEVTMQLSKGNKEEMEEIVKNRKTKRMESQPLDLPSAGSVFRNVNSCSAWQIIEDLGFRGYQLGGAKVSEKHANFIVNTGNAKAADIKNLIDFIQKEAKEKKNVDLIVEQKMINF